MFNTLVYAPTFFVAFACLFTVAELVRPARPIRYREVLGGDLIALALYELVIAPAAMSLSGLLSPDHFVVVFRAALGLPLAVRVALYLVAIDFAMYWLHRLLHSRPLWPIHRWHHSPPYMYWLAGIRGTLPQEVLYFLPGIVCLPLLHDAPAWVFLAIFAAGFFSNNWMHTNVTWRSRRLEWVLVTPRYHHVHHANNPAIYTANLAATFTIWDRLFGTYVDPDTVGDVAFGIDRQYSTARLALGI